MDIPESKDRYSIHDINIKSGIFCIEKDKFQDMNTQLPVRQDIQLRQKIH